MLIESPYASIFERNGNVGHIFFPFQEADTEGWLPEYVQTLLDGVDPSVPLKARRNLTVLLLEHARVFSHDGDLGRATAVKHGIDTGEGGIVPFVKL